MDEATTEMIVNSFEYQMYRMLRFFIMWTSMYIIIHLTINTSLKNLMELDMKNRIISIFHGLASFGLSFYYLISNGFNLESPLDYFNSGIICLSFAYFLYDLIACLIFSLWDIKLIIHHMLCVSGMFALLWFTKGLNACVAGLVLAEASNLPMHIRCICRNFGMKHTKLCEYCETTYILIYVIFRGILAPVLCVLTFLSPSTPIFIAFVMLGIVVQSFFFIITMISMMKKKMSNAEERSKKNVPLYWFEVNPDIYDLEYVQNTKKINIF